MSIESIALALHHSHAKGTVKLVLLGIANHDGDGGAWPSVATLAKYAACDERQVQRAVKQLEELGEIRRQVGAGGNDQTRADRRPNRYQFLLRCPTDCDGTKSHRKRGDTGDTPSDHGVTSTAERGDIHGSHGVVEMSPEPSLEPSIEPLAPAARERPRDLLFETVAELCGYTLTALTKTARGRLNAAVKELRDIAATPEQVRAVVRTYRRTYPDATVTPQAITGNWAAMATGPARAVCECGQYADLHDQQVHDIVTGDHHG